MKFILNHKKYFGNTILTLFECLEDQGIQLTDEDQDNLINLYLNNGFPKKFYKDNILNLDQILEDPECIYDFIE